MQGTYSGTGSFSASAQTADKDRAAQAQVSGSKDTALSSSQGTGGVGKSQAQVQLDSKTGEVHTTNYALIFFGALQLCGLSISYITTTRTELSLAKPKASGT